MSAARLRAWAAWGARHGPDWFVRWAPVCIGAVAFLVASSARRSVLSNLRRIHGPRELPYELWDALCTFSAFARNLTEALCPERFFATERVVLRGRPKVLQIVESSGLIMVSAHVGPWDSAAMTLHDDIDRPVMMLLAEEDDDGAAARVQDQVRAATRVQVVRLGRSPFDALPVGQHLAAGGVVAAQMDRNFGSRPPIEAELFGAPFGVSPGLLRLAAASRCPIVPVFSARLEGGARLVQVGDPITVQSRPQPRDLQRAAQSFLTQLECHLRRFPTQWFHFVSEPSQ